MSEMNHVVEIDNQVQSVMGTENWLAAIKILKGELPAVEEDWRLSWNLGWCYFKLERWDDARKHLIRATKLAPQNAICKWALGIVYREIGQLKKAEKLLAEALQIKDSYIGRISLALAYLQQGKVLEAENTHLEGIKLKPESRERLEA